MKQLLRAVGADEKALAVEVGEHGEEPSRKADERAQGYKSYVAEGKMILQFRQTDFELLGWRPEDLPRGV